jgi:hypothetical protein
MTEAERKLLRATALEKVQTAKVKRSEAWSRYLNNPRKVISRHLRDESKTTRYFQNGQYLIVHRVGELPSFESKFIVFESGNPTFQTNSIGFLTPFLAGSYSAIKWQRPLL